MNDLIKREDAIKAMEQRYQDILRIFKRKVKDGEKAVVLDMIGCVKSLPSAEITHDDVMQYCNSRLLVLATVESIKHQYRIGFEDGKASADRPQGEWIDAEIPLECGGSMPIQVCNLCKTFYPLAYTGGGHRFCPNCGCRMKDVTEGLESRTDLIWYGDKIDLIGDETGRHTGWFGKGADDENKD